MTKINTKTLKGFRELLPAEQMEFNRMLDIIKDTYELNGFIPIDTPILERAETLLAKAGGETEKQIYQFTKGKTNYAMRFDHTVPLARYVAEHERELAFPFRRYAIGKVYRGERPQAGRLREFYQCDIDIIGKEKLPIISGMEILYTISTIFIDLLPHKLKDKFTIRVNSRRLLNGFYQHLAVDKVVVMRIVDKLDKIGESGVTMELLEAGVNKESIRKIISFIQIDGSNKEVLKKLKDLDITNTLFTRGIKDLADISKVPDFEHLKLDLSIARGLDYYTGIVYETTLDDYPEIGSICSGGEYEDLASTYSNSKLPGIGVSIGLSRLFDQLKTNDLLNLKASTPTKVLYIYTPSSSDRTDEQTNLWISMVKLKIPSEQQIVIKISKALKYANKLGIPKVVIVGENEAKNNTYTLKDMKSGNEDKEITKEVLLEKLKKEFLK